MATGDRSRDIFDPDKHYHGVGMQQGRVLTDDDYNEGERIRLEDQRRARLDMIGSHGSPDTGFAISSPERSADGGSIDFTIEAGSFYLGGLRVQRPQQQFQTQRDWLLNPGVESPQGKRSDLVYLEVWEQPVSAVEDQELYEKALGGPDTSYRLRTMARVRVLPGVDTDDCTEGWKKLEEFWRQHGLGQLNSARELVPGTQTHLEVGFQTGGEREDLCTPEVSGGYLGAENQAIRVELTGKDHFTWGFDNAAPLYRVDLKSPSSVVMRTPPRDQAHRPVPDQVVEILPLSARLPNGEPLAEELRNDWSPVKTPHAGQFAKVKGYDADSDEITLDRDLSLDGGGQAGFFYLRIWDRGSDLDSDTEINLGSNPTLLGNTGLNIAVTGDPRPGDYWIIAARPETPDRVVPWSLETDNGGRPPHGVRRFYAPLALIHWRENAAVEVEDCRKTFRPLTETESCCSFTVGDGDRSHGMLNSIEAALDHLPPGGGEICLLPGVHQANVTIENRRNIVIRGCGQRTRVIPKSANADQDKAIFTITDCRSITLTDMDLATFSGTAIVLQGSGMGNLRDIEIAHNRLLACRQGIQVTRGVDIRLHHNRIRLLDKENADVGVSLMAEDSLIQDNEIQVIGPLILQPEMPGRFPGLEDIPLDPLDPCTDLARVYDNIPFLGAYVDLAFNPPPVEEGATDEPSGPTFNAEGGVRIEAGSERIRVLDNVIRSGGGNGITLGSPISLPGDDGARRGIEHNGGTIRGQVVAEDTGAGVGGVNLEFAPHPQGDPLSVASRRDSGFFKLSAGPGEYQVSVVSPGYRVESVSRDDSGFRVTVSEVSQEPDDALAFLHDIRIERNDIAEMGLSGIGIPQLPSADRDATARMGIFRFGQPIMGLIVHRNRIHDCLRKSLADTPRAQTGQGFGGISLGFCEDVTIDANRIEANGRDAGNFASAAKPVCGIFIRLGRQVNIHHNSIVDNGPLFPTDRDLDQGVRGGIVMQGFMSLGGEQSFQAATNLDAGSWVGRIDDNVVDQPAGRALSLQVIGLLSVCNNRFNAEYSEDDKGGAVFIINLGGVSDLPEGATLFNGNYTRLGPASTSSSMQAIVITDDLGFEANQSHSRTGGGEDSFYNTALVARTVRATSSRFKGLARDDTASLQFSLFSIGVHMNNTTNNQGDHCIVVAGADVVDNGNQMPDRELCEAIAEGYASRSSGFNL